MDISDIEVNEDVGTIQVSVTGTGESSVPISFDYTIQNVSTSDQDYEDRGTGTVILSGNDGATSTIVIDIIDDEEIEGTEVFEVVLSNPSEPSGLLQGDATAIVTVIDNDVDINEVTFDITNLEIGESDGQLSVSVTATDNIPEGVTVNVNYDAVAGTAVAGQDFEVSNGL